VFFPDKVSTKFVFGQWLPVFFPIFEKNRVGSRELILGPRKSSFEKNHFFSQAKIAPVNSAFSTKNPQNEPQRKC